MKGLIVSDWLDASRFVYRKWRLFQSRQTEAQGNGGARNRPGGSPCIGLFQGKTLAKMVVELTERHRSEIKDLTRRFGAFTRSIR